jgi:protein-S-isoprenylcysteine O-methyltransferase Ste14
VLIQAILFAGVIAAGLASTRWPKSLRLPAVVIAIILGAAGLALVASAVGSLGSSVSPFPRPAAASELKERGVYALVRHPIYGGIVLLSLAWSLAVGPLALMPTVVLALALVFKSRLEERWLIDRHPAYTAYRMRVRRRFVPFLW